MNDQTPIGEMQRENAPRIPTYRERRRAQALAVGRLARELRGFLGHAPADDPEVASILADCTLAEDAARDLAQHNRLEIS